MVLLFALRSHVMSAGAADLTLKADSPLPASIFVGRLVAFQSQVSGPKKLLHERLKVDGFTTVCFWSGDLENRTFLRRHVLGWEVAP